MKRLLIGIAIVLALVLPFSMPVTSQTSSSSSRRPVTTTFAALGTPANKEWRWCSDCNAASPCTSGGTGAFAYRVGSAWNCTNHLIGAGTGDALVANPLSQFAATTSAQLAGVLTNETGSGLAVFATTPTLTTPVLGVATATSINKWVLTAPTTAATLTAGGDSLTYTMPEITASIGFRNVPQNSQSAAYTTVLTDAGKHIYHPSADTTARTFTIDSNANVAFPVGTVITIVNDCSAGVLTISITSDTLILAGAGTTGSRTLAACGIATAIKMTTTRWMINGTGLT